MIMDYFYNIWDQGNCVEPNSLIHIRSNRRRLLPSQLSEASREWFKHMHNISSESTDSNYIVVTT